MQVEKKSEWNYGNYALEKRELKPEDTNEIRHVSLRVSELIEIIGKKPICEVRELPNRKTPIHVIVDPDAQKLIEKFHRYGPNPNYGKESNCPFQGGTIQEKFIALVGSDNLISNYEETSKAQRKTLHAFFTKDKLEELKPIWKRITEEWLTKQMWQRQVFLFDAVLKLSCECLIRGVMGYNRCSDADIALNTNFWKTLLDPTPSEQKSFEDYELAGEGGYIQRAWNFYQDSTDIVQKLRAYFFTSKEIDRLTLLIYNDTVSIKGTVSHHLMSAGYDQKMILENLKGLLIAGQETVGYLLGYILYEYAKNPFMQDNHASNSEKIKDAYLESLRLYSVGGVQREAAMDMVLKYAVNGQNTMEHYIRKGDLIACIPLLSGHNSLYWNDPETFNSEREDLENVRKNPHFGSGVHRCIGQVAAETEILTILETVLSNAVITANSELPELLNAFTLRPKYDVSVSFKSNFTSSFG